MDYLNWKYRTVPFFLEEQDETDRTGLPKPSIKSFQQIGLYSPHIRKQLTDYIESCKLIIATSIRRYNPYLDQYSFEMGYYTDGEVIFNNFLMSYIRQEDFVLPQSWFNLIRRRDFEPVSFHLDFNLITRNTVDIYKTIRQTFAEAPEIGKVIW